MNARVDLTYVHCNTATGPSRYPLENEGDTTLRLHQSPIRCQLRRRIDRGGGGDAPASRSGAIAKLRNEREKLLSLYLDDKITSDFFAEKERGITAKIEAIESDHAEAIEQVRRHSALADAFEKAATLLRDPAFDFDTVWDHANDKERRVLIEELIETITIFPDRLEVTVTGAPPLLVTLDEVGLRSPGTGSLVSEADLNSGKAIVRSCPLVSVVDRLSWSAYVLDDNPCRLVMSDTR